MTRVIQVLFNSKILVYYSLQQKIPKYFYFPSLGWEKSEVLFLNWLLKILKYFKNILFYGMDENSTLKNLLSNVATYFSNFFLYTISRGEFSSPGCEGNTRVEFLLPRGRNCKTDMAICLYSYGFHFKDK